MTTTDKTATRTSQVNSETGRTQTMTQTNKKVTRTSKVKSTSPDSLATGIFIPSPASMATHHIGTPDEKEERLCFPSLQDITDENYYACRLVLLEMLEEYKLIQIVMEPGAKYLKDLCGDLTAYGTEQVQFLFKMNNPAGKREDCAANLAVFKKQLRAVKYAHDCGYQTSILCRHILDPRYAKLLASAIPYVTDAIYMHEPYNEQTVGLRCDQEEYALASAEIILSLEETTVGPWNQFTPFIQAEIQRLKHKIRDIIIMAHRRGALSYCNPSLQ